jgi:hypothetical protein
MMIDIRGIGSERRAYFREPRLRKVTGKIEIQASVQTTDANIHLALRRIEMRLGFADCRALELGAPCVVSKKRRASQRRNPVLGWGMLRDGRSISISQNRCVAAESSTNLHLA